MTSVPPPPTARSASSGPGPIWYVVAAVLVGATVAAVVALWPSSPTFSDFWSMLDVDRFDAPGETVVTLDEPGAYNIYVRTNGPRRDGAQAEWHVTAMREADDEAIPVDDPSIAFTLNVNQREYEAIGRFELSRPGAVRVRVVQEAADPDALAEMAVGTAPSPGDMFGKIGRSVAAAGVALLGLAGAVAIALVTFFRRRRARQTAEAGPMFPPTA